MEINLCADNLLVVTFFQVNFRIRHVSIEMNKILIVLLVLSNIIQNKWEIIKNIAPGLTKEKSLILSEKII